MPTTDGILRVLSLGGGLDSFAMLLDAIDRGDMPDVVVFADVADSTIERENVDPGEWPGTYRHLREVVAPLCAARGLRFAWISSDLYPIRGTRSLFRYFEQTHTMPTRMSRLCTSASKVERVADFLAAEYPGRPVEMWIGFEAGEEVRAAKDPHAESSKGSPRTSRFPLLEHGFCRCRCEALVRSKGFPVPRKSACVYCPFSSRGDFQTLARDLPETFARVAALEEDCKTTKSGKTLRYGYAKGDGTDPALAEWSSKPYRARAMGCAVCGAVQRASKATGCDYLSEGSE